MLTDEYLSPSKCFYRLLDEYQNYGSLVVAYDFDNTVYDFHKKGSTYNDVIKLLQDLKSIRCELICFTANEDDGFVINYCKENNIPLDRLNENPEFFKHCTSKKIYYNALLDDRAGLTEVYNNLRLLHSTITKQNN